ncbi:MAG TPA: M1 family metallopeptidase [Gemmatimonadota bacterium]|nr:M1 family metallopeptidase [Gemmatimonadota bacterium]
MITRAALALSLVASTGSPGWSQVAPDDSGGPLLPEQAAYDVSYYELDLEVEPADSTISGQVTVHARVGSPLEWLVLDLVPELEVRSTRLIEAGSARELALERKGGRLWLRLPRTYQPGETVVATIAYGGRPRIAVRPPWNGGFTWERTASNEPWIATTCQTEGADLWWPVKDHVSDEPDSMAIRVTVPDGLVVASNGRLVATESVSAGRTAFRWFVSVPINTYNVALNIAPYRVIEDEFTSVSGDVFPVRFYVLPEDYERGVAFLPEIERHLRFYESRLGPYPARTDKYGVAQTPHLGMEHQSIIAYGAGFSNLSMTPQDDFGFDKLHHHELAHEWWGNLVTNADWKDWWIHEGFGTYMQVLYAEELSGPEGYMRYLDAIRPLIGNRLAVAPREPMTVAQMEDRDIYFKGAWILHTLRYLIGPEALDQSLRRMAYPSPALERSEDGGQFRFASTEEFIGIVEGVAGKDLSWFFETYLRQPLLPELRVVREGTTLAIAWVTPNGLPFPMPLEVAVGDELVTVDMKDGIAVLQVPEEAAVIPDPRRRILKAGPAELVGPFH